jgi:N-methylhydantoinase B/oxoprolinase/acetone carboxylase alpha subunit
MATTIFRTAHSTVVRDGMDFSAALCDPNGDTVAQAVTEVIRDRCSRSRASWRRRSRRP